MPPKTAIESREQTISSHDQIAMEAEEDPDHLLVYTDGSGHQGLVGAAAVALKL